MESGHVHLSILDLHFLIPKLKDDGSKISFHTIKKCRSKSILKIFHTIKKCRSKSILNLRSNFLSTLFQPWDHFPTTIFSFDIQRKVGNVFLWITLPKK